MKNSDAKHTEIPLERAAAKQGIAERKRPVFLLYGMGGTFNYGCEAIARGTEWLLRQRWPDAVIRCAAFDPADDQRRLSGTRIDFVRRKKIGRYHWRRILSYAAFRFCPRRLVNQEDTGILRGVDAVLCVGGDLYTLNASGRFPRGLMAFGESCLRRGKKYLLWGASIGPFDRFPEVERLVVDHLSRITLTTVREPVTSDYLKKIGVTRFIEFPDPAFFVGQDQTQDADRAATGVVGVNLSPLSVRYADLNPEETLRRQADGLADWACRRGVRLLLLPHVVCRHSAGDDDLRYLEQMARRLRERLGDAVELAADDPGFLGIRRRLLGCDALIASRMHCAVNALSAGIPTLLLAYSAKARGMSRFVYGNEDWVMKLTDFPGREFTEKASNLLDRGPELRRRLLERKAEILRSAADQLREWNFIGGGFDVGSGAKVTADPAEFRSPDGNFIEEKSGGKP